MHSIGSSKLVLKNKQDLRIMSLLCFLPLENMSFLFDKYDFLIMHPMSWLLQLIITMSRSSPLLPFKQYIRHNLGGGQRKTGVYFAKLFTLKMAHSGYFSPKPKAGPKFIFYLIFENWTWVNLLNEVLASGFGLHI